ncbi:TetR/AcrR family transcriptional regulator [Paractinoplanes durhamensis]|uniref:TetR family transcriptional regulator n=1 Tax=Paractinoplanes durhamensis TaxID=113563 RepID=A0ABQ3ZCS6_9ACTN|nr:TetR/AcrR family transcriptional regulator [Actinoplanes durhamensis]GIE07596.1 TetR family transcriptional regulator [Actinoplanes durhamensis]
MTVLTRKGEQTRLRIVTGAAAEIRERGVAAARLEDVMTRTSTSKSQLFHYFPGGKEELLLAVARHEADQVLADQQPMLGDLSSWAAWQQWRDSVVRRYLAQGQECPLNSLLGQSGSRSPGARAVTAELIRQWLEALVIGIHRMQAAGEIAAAVDAERAAAALIAGIQGGVIIFLSTGRITHLEAALDVGIEGLRASTRLF